MISRISKKLSANDIGETGGHQAGILVPKEKEILNFFPSLNSKYKNPRLKILVREIADNTKWDFNYIYYNSKLFGGTRNEYRLTGMTKYLRSTNVKVGDELLFSKDENDSIYVGCQRVDENKKLLTEKGVIVLSGGWKIINI